VFPVAFGIDDDDGGGDGLRVVVNAPAVPLAWPKRGHSPGGSTTTAAVATRVVAVGKEVVGTKM